MRFLLTLLTLYFIWLVVKFLFKLAFRYWLKKNAGKAFFYSGGFGGQNPFSHAQNPYGPGSEIRVENPGTSSKSKKKSQEQLGEYVDFEELK
jgi:hypothetical protein